MTLYCNGQSYAALVCGAWYTHTATVGHDVLFDPTTIADAVWEAE